MPKFFQKSKSQNIFNPDDFNPEKIKIVDNIKQYVECDETKIGPWQSERKNCPDYVKSKPWEILEKTRREYEKGWYTRYFKEKERLQNATIEELADDVSWQVGYRLTPEQARCPSICMYATGGSMSKCFESQSRLDDIMYKAEQEQIPQIQKASSNNSP